MDEGIENQAIHTPSLFEVCSDALSEVLRWYVLLFSLNTRYFVLPQHKAVIDIVIPQIAHMKPLAEEAISTCDYRIHKPCPLRIDMNSRSNVVPLESVLEKSMIHRM